MEKLTSILVVIDPVDETRHVVAKAMVLARHFGARLELFLCDSEQAFILRHTYDPKGTEEALRGCLVRGERYLHAMRTSLADDVQISTHVASSSPLYEAVVRRVLEMKPDLVIKSAAGHHPLQRFTLDANDWQLARTCPAPLMLTRGRPWAAQPSFAAAIDVSEREGAGLARSILHTSGYLAQGCRASLDVVFSDVAGAGHDSHKTNAESLSRLVHEFRVGEERLHVLQGEAEVTLPAFAARQDYDVIVLGALTRRRGISALMGTLTTRLVDSLECDFVLVKPESYACPVKVPRRAATG
ncbi:MAG: universal stress protein [Gammaproteobacteria bacterium]